MLKKEDFPEILLKTANNLNNILNVKLSKYINEKQEYEKDNKKTKPEINLTEISIFDQYALEEYQNFIKYIIFSNKQLTKEKFNTYVSAINKCYDYLNYIIIKNEVLKEKELEVIYSWVLKKKEANISYTLTAIEIKTMSMYLNMKKNELENLTFVPEERYVGSSGNYSGYYISSQDRREDEYEDNYEEHQKYLDKKGNLESKIYSIELLLNINKKDISRSR